MAALVEHRLFSSPLVSVRDVLCSSDQRGPGAEEASAEHLIVFTRAGAFVRHQRGQRETADPNHVLFFDPHHGHRISHPVGCGDRCTAVSVAEPVLRSWLERVAPASAEREHVRFPTTSTTVPAGLDLSHRQLIRLLAENRPLAVEETVFDWLDRLGPARRSTVPRDRAARSRRRDLVDAARLELNRRKTSRLDLSGLAVTLRCSPYHLSRVFRSETGCTLSRYLDRLRLRAAVERLLDGERDLSVLATEVGYANHSHFSRRFREEYRTTPGRVRSDWRGPATQGG